MAEVVATKMVKQPVAGTKLSVEDAVRVARRVLDRWERITPGVATEVVKVVPVTRQEGSAVVGFFVWKRVPSAYDAEHVYVSSMMTMTSDHAAAMAYGRYDLTRKDATKETRERAAREERAVVG